MASRSGEEKKNREEIRFRWMLAAARCTVHAAAHGPSSMLCDVVKSGRNENKQMQWCTRA